VVAVIGILAAVAYPAYQDYVIRSKRGDAMNALASLRIAQEKFRANNISFASDETNVDGVNYSISSDRYWDIEIVASGSTPDSANFYARATPRSPHSDANCSVFLVDRNGPVYTSSQNQECWER